MGFWDWLTGGDDKPQRQQPVNVPPRGSPEAESRSSGNVAQLQHPGHKAQRWGNTAEIWSGLGQEKYRGSDAGAGGATQNGPNPRALPPATKGHGLAPFQAYADIINENMGPGAPRQYGFRGNGPGQVPNAGGGPFPELNSTNRALLEALGWTVPGAQPIAAAATLDHLLDMGKARDLKDYQYNVERPELELLQMATKGKKGVIQGEDLTAGDRSVTTGGIKAVPMTQEAYKALTPEQKRAVDFNTMFVEAREKDLALTNEEGRGSTYDKAIEEMFGKQGGATKYAPNTVDLLGKIGYQAKGQDLDEYLTGANLVSLDELQNFKFTDTELKQNALTPRSQVGVDQYIETRNTPNQLLAQEQLVELAGAYIDQTLQNTQVWDVPSAAVFSATGAPPTGATVPWGFGVATDRVNAQGTYDNPLDETRDQDLRDAYTMMQNPENSIDRFWTTANDLGMNDDDLQKMFNYFDLQSRKDAGTGVQASGVRTPQEMRELFGLGGL